MNALYYASMIVDLALIILLVWDMVFVAKTNKVCKQQNEMLREQNNQLWKIVEEFIGKIKKTEGE